MARRTPPGPPDPTTDATDTPAPKPGTPKPAKPPAPPAPVELETPTGRIIARPMPARGRDSAGRWYWRARRSVAGKQTDVWTGRGHRPEVLEKLTAIAAGLAPAASARRDRGAFEAPRTVADLLDRWLTDRVDGARDLAPETRRAYRIRSAAIRQTIGHVALEALAVRHLLAHKAARELEGAASTTIVVDLAIFRIAWRWGVDCGFAHGDLPRLAIRARAKRGRTPTEAEVFRVVEKAPRLIRLALVVQAATGARIGEVTRLQHADIELNTEAGTGVLHLGRHEGARKTGARSVPIWGEVVAALAEVHRPGEPRGVWGKGSDQRVQVFLRSLDWPALKMDPFTSHGIRRLAADRMARAGVEVAAAAAFLGHSPMMMLNIYRQVSPDDLSLAARRAGLGSLAPGNVVGIDTARKGAKS